MKIFVSAGEASGDLHGANLIKALRRLQPDVVIYGLGGPRMAAVGCSLHEDMVKRSGMWFWHVWVNFFHYLSVLRRIVSGFVTDPPDAVVLIDSPGFNVRIAAHAKARGIPVIYYITPQTWAWASMRFPKIARRVDKMLNILPFEPELWRLYGVDCEYVGHPIFDHLAGLQLAPVQRVKEFADRQAGQPALRLAGLPAYRHNSSEDTKAPLIGLLPGSRYREIDDLLPIMLDAGKIIKAEIPAARFRLVCANEELHDRINRTVSAHSLPVDVVVGAPYDVMREATLCLVSCGTANLELASFATPMVVLYRVVWYGFWVRGPFISTDYISLVNILAGREIVPECLMLTAKPVRVARRALELLQDEQKRQACVAALNDLRTAFAHPGASARAAEEIMRVVEKARHLRHPGVESRTPCGGCFCR